MQMMTMMTTTRTDDDKDFCCHEVMMMMRRRSRRRTTTRIDDNKDYCCEEKKEDNEDKDMDVCMVPIGQYIIHRTQHPTRYDIITNGRYTLIRAPCTLPSMYKVFRTNMISSYRTINRFIRLIIYAWINSIVIILGGTDGHGRDNEFN